MGFTILEEDSYFFRHLECADFWARFEVDISWMECWTTGANISLGEKRFVVPAVELLK